MRSLVATVLLATLTLAAETGQAQETAAPPAAPSDASAVAGNEDGAQQLVRGNAEQAVAAYTNALKDTGLANDRRATVLNDRAVAYARLGRSKEALADYNKAVELFPEYPAAYNNRGNLLLSLGQPKEAVKDFDRSILLAPSYAAAYSNRANARLVLGQPNDALTDFTKAIELMPASAAPLSGRGLAYLASGKPHAAIRDFSRAVNADARFASAYRNRAEARIGVGQKEESIEDLSRAIAFDMSNAELYIARGYAYMSAANVASAIKDFTRAIELDARSAPAYAARGLANSLAEAYDEAYADLNRALEIDPRLASAFAFRAYAYKQNNQLDIASKDVETALKLSSDLPEALWVRGEISEARGEADTAVADLRNALARKPSWHLALEALKRLGASLDDGNDRVVEGLGIDTWRVVLREGAYFAVNDTWPELRVPLEMMGEGKPQLLSWEVKEPPYGAYGILKFSGGQVTGKNGPEATELAAVIDIEGRKVIAVQPHRQGARVAGWTWEEGRLQVASIDGVTDEFALHTAKPAPASAPSSGSSRRTYASESSGATWAPWDQPLGMPSSAREPRPQKKYKQKPKTLFQLLFN